MRANRDDSLELEMRSKHFFVASSLTSCQYSTQQ